MDKLTNNVKITDYAPLSQMKKKIKQFLTDKGCEDIRLDNFSQNLAVSMVHILDELATDSLKYVTKHQLNGLYVVNKLMIDSTIAEFDKYHFCYKYIKKFNPIVRYEDSLLFNLSKVLAGFELINGNKLTFDAESRNFISFIMLSFQYDILELSVTILSYGSKKTMTKSLIVSCLKYILNNEISNRIDLKLDSLQIIIADKKEDDDEVKPNDATNNEANNTTNNEVEANNVTNDEVQTNNATDNEVQTNINNDAVITKTTNKKTKNKK